MHTYRYIKRGIDVSVAAVLLTVTSPVLGLVALLVRRHDGGDVLYRASRVGQGGEEFTMLKFRTMVIDAESRGGSSTGDDDPRITSVGRRLRAHKLDELPQLLNVLRGDMSLVGPRPQVAWDVARYTREERRLLEVAPGITDWASIKFRDEGQILAREADPDEAYDRLIRPEKIRLGLEYVERQSFRTDMAILAGTMRAVAERETVSSEYSRITEAWDTGADPQQWELAQQRYSLAAHLGSDKDVLEVGCGTGYGLAKLQAMAATVVGIDPDERNIAAARHEAPECDFRLGDADSLGVPDASADLVLGLEMIYYVPDRARFLVEVRRVLRDNGKLLLTFPNRARPGFHPSPFSTSYPDYEAVVGEVEAAGMNVDVYGTLPLQDVSPGAEVLRRLAVRAHLIPTTLRGRARMKRLLGRELRPMRTIAPDPHVTLETLERVESSADAARFGILVVVASNDAGPLAQAASA